MILVCHITSLDHVTKMSSKIMVRSLVTTLLNLVAIGTVVVDIQ